MYVVNLTTIGPPRCQYGNLCIMMHECGTCGRHTDSNTGKLPQTPKRHIAFRMTAFMLR